MIKYRARLIYEDGTEDEDDELFDSYSEAESRAEDMITDYRTGAEVLNASNPGDYPDDGSDEDIEIEIDEVEVDSDGNEI